MKKFLIVIAVLCVCVSSSAYGESLEEMISIQVGLQTGDPVATYRAGNIFVRRGEYKDAFECFSFAAQKGYVPAQYNLGVMYRNGTGVERNYEKAFDWFGKASASGNFDGTYGLACMYDAGEYVEKDRETAYSLWSHAAFHGHKASQRAINIEVIPAEELGKEFNQNKLKFKRTYGNRKIIVRGKVADIDSEMSTNNAVVTFLASVNGYTDTYIKCSVKEEISPDERSEESSEEEESFDAWEPFIYSIQKGQYATIEGTLSGLGMFSVEMKDCTILTID